MKDRIGQMGLKLKKWARTFSLHFSLLFAASCLVIQLTSTDVFAITNLKKVVQVSDQQIDLVFDKALSEHNVNKENLGEMTQLTVLDAQVYPAKISIIKNAAVSKVFAYQYSAKSIRVRFNGNAKSHFEDLEVKVKGPVLSVHLAKAVVNSPVKMSVLASPRSEKRVDQNSNSEDSQGQNTLTEKPSIQSMDKIELGQAKSVKKDEIKSEPVKKVSQDLTPDDLKVLGNMQTVGTGLIKDSAQQVKASSLSSDKPKEDAITVQTKKMMIKLGLVTVVMVMFLGGFYFIKRWVPRMSSNSKLTGFLKSVRKKKLIEVMATQYLGPKKSVAVVKVSGKILVLGITQDHINLISEMDDGAGDDEGVEDDINSFVRAPKKEQNVSLEPAVFSQVLSDLGSKPQNRTSTRAQIKSKLQNLRSI